MPEWIPIYFVKNNDKEYRCNICEDIIITNEKSAELLEHIKNSHKEVCDLHKDNTEAANIGFQIEFLQFNVKEVEKPHPVILEQICEVTGEMVKTEQKPEKDGVQFVLVPSKKKAKISCEFSRKRSWVWKYFDKLTSIIYRCNLCNVVLSIKGCNTNNMNRHVRTRHPSVYKAEMENKNDDAKCDMDLLDPVELGWKKDDESDKTKESINIMKQRRSWIWSYFKRMSNTLAQCKLCQRNICHGGNATGNMNRHLKMVHNKTAETPEWIPIYFGKNNDKEYRCNICEDIIITNEKSAELLEHIKNSHKGVYDLHKDNTEAANTGFQIEFLQFNVKEVEKAHPVILEKICEVTGEMVKTEHKPEKDGVQYLLMPSKKKANISRDVSRKRSWVWKYFDKITSTMCRCNLCNAVISIITPSSMNRHVRGKHPSVYKAEVEKKNGDAKCDMDLLDPLELGSEKDEENDKTKESIIIKNQRRGSIWTYFKRTSNTLAQCKLCQHNIRHDGYSTGNLHRHLKMVHSKTADVSKKRSWVWKYFDKITSTMCRCNLCNAVISIITPSSMNRHVRGKHPSVYKAEVEKKNGDAKCDMDLLDPLELGSEKDEENDKTKESIYIMKQQRSWIWSYFKRMSNTLAQCKLCQHNIRHDGYSTGNLHRHLKMVHNKTADVSRKRSWVWKYFDKITSTMCRCNLCNAVISIITPSSMNRHVRGKHPSVYKAEVEKKNGDAKCDMDLLDPLELGSEKDEENDKTKESINVSRKRSWVWKYFDKITSTMCRCNLCNAVISIITPSSMNRHVRGKHPSVYKAEVEKKNGDAKCDMDLLDPLELGSEKDEENDKTKESINTMKQRRSWIWSYFKRMSYTLAQCQLCHRNIRHGESTTGSMNRHLKMVHNKTADDTNWIWKVFENEEHELRCKICHFKCVKFDDADNIKCILLHLKSEHGVVSSDQIFIETE